MAVKILRREKMGGAGKQYAPTLYTVLVNPDDDQRLFGYYPTLAGETETYLAAKASSDGLVMDGHPLVRFIVDDTLKHGKFDIIAEPVAAPIIAQLRAEEMRRYGIAGAPGRPGGAPYGAPQTPQSAGFAGAGMGANFDPFAPQTPDPMADAFAPGAAVADPFAPQSAAPSVPFPAGQNPFAAGAGAGAGAGANVAGMGAGVAGDMAAAGAVGGAAGAAGAAAGIGAAGAAGAAAAGAAAAGIAAPTTVFAGGTAAPNAGAASARLINTNDNRSYDLASARLILGREQSCDITVDDLNVSRTHAELRREPQGFWLLNDLGSTNGTYVNGTEVSSHILQPGDRITLGVTTFVFALS